MQLLFHVNQSATLIFEVELVACGPRKGSRVANAIDERARLD
ncbi:putative peptidylprolyl isomerase [Helianthus annuus]|nr:putative peptidylprolyl isomerase [Helianthus annuus]